MIMMILLVNDDDDDDDDDDDYDYGQASFMMQMASADRAPPWPFWLQGARRPPPSHSPLPPCTRTHTHTPQVGVPPLVGGG